MCAHACLVESCILPGLRVSIAAQSTYSVPTKIVGKYLHTYLPEGQYPGSFVSEQLGVVTMSTRVFLRTAVLATALMHHACGTYIVEWIVSLLAWMKMFEYHTGSSFHRVQGVDFLSSLLPIVRFANLP